MFKPFTEGVANPEAAALQNKAEAVNRMASELPDPGQKLEPAVNSLGGLSDAGENRQSGRQVEFHRMEGAGKFMIGELTDRRPETVETASIFPEPQGRPDIKTLENPVHAAESQSTERSAVDGISGAQTFRDGRSVRPDVITTENRVSDAAEIDPAETRAEAIGRTDDFGTQPEHPAGKATMENRVTEREEEPLHAALEHLMDDADDIAASPESASDSRREAISEIPAQNGPEGRSTELPRQTLEHRVSDQPEDNGRTPIGSKLPEGRLNPAIFDAASFRAPEAVRTTLENRIADPAERTDAPEDVRATLTNQIEADSSGRFTVYGSEETDA